MSTSRERTRETQRLDLATPPETVIMRVLLTGFDTAGRRALFAAADGPELVTVTDADSLHRALRDPVDAVVCDARLEPHAALAALALVREHDWALPVLVLVSRLDSETAAEAHRIGASWILRAPFTCQDVLDAIASIR